MKQLLCILLFICTFSPLFAQDEEGPGEIKLREKMISFIQSRLGLTRAEAERFQPVFVNYFRELKRTKRQFRGQGLEQQQKLLEVRMRYRDQFKPIIGEKRSNEVFDHEREFIRTVVEEIGNRRQERMERRANQRKKSGILLAN